jgi:hypothetical protein
MRERMMASISGRSATPLHHSSNPLRTLRDLCDPFAFFAVKGFSRRRPPFFSAFSEVSFATFAIPFAIFALKSFTL